MGLIREPIEIDFTLISKIWTAEEEKEFSELIKWQKTKYQRHTISGLKAEMEYLVPEFA
jgi:hypothetical protein